MTKKFRDISGVFILDKPIGISSNQALQQVKRIFKAEKAGHTGSLDVLASGLLPICFGEATKFSQYLLDADKYYRTTAVLGKRTTTCDAEGAITEEKPTDKITPEKVNQVLKQFTGEIEQVPSMFSALKHQGKPLYELARKGIEIERKSRKITIYKIELLSYKQDRLILDVWCSKGAYIRNLVDDIGQALECGAYVSELRRLGSGPFTENQMITIEQLEKEISSPVIPANAGIQVLNPGGKPQNDNENVIDKHLLPIEIMFENIPEIILTEQEIQKLYFGQIVQTMLSAEKIIQLKSLTNKFIGMGEIDFSGRLISKRLLKLRQMKNPQN